MSLVTERIPQHCKQLKLLHLATEWLAIAERSVKGNRPGIPSCVLAGYTDCRWIRRPKQMAASNAARVPRFG